MSEQTLPFMEPCGHAQPQADSQLHGVCVFCYRDRLAESHRKNDALRERVAELEVVVEYARRLAAVRAEFVGVSDHMPEHPGNEYWIEKFMGAYEPLEAALAAILAEKGIEHE